MPSIARCGSCKAPVYFVPSKVSKKLCIINADPDPNGSIILQEVDGVEVAVHLSKDTADLFAEQPAGTRYVDHHKTCPQSEAWRNKKKKS